MEISKNDSKISSTPPLLSIIIISHNQRKELKHCIECVLAQDIPIEYEIILSDDRSIDGTFELAKEYAATHPRIIVSQCNSDECNPANNSQRSGWNRCNGYKLAKGKYIAHVDADDYFRPRAKVYEKQIKALEAHPECALAMSTCLCVNEGELLETGKPWGFPKKMIDGEIIEQQDFVRGDWFRLNQCFIQRRNPDIDPVSLYGKRYVDSVITYHHLQFGKVVYVDACDYVYVGHPGSIVSNLAHDNKDRTIMWCLGLYIPALIPVWTKDFYMGCYYQSIRDVIKLAQSGYRLKEGNYNGLKDMHIWIYDCFARDMNLLDKMRLKLTDMWMKMIKITGWESNLNIRILNALLTK